jgi:outer membrane receptor for ferrienterochelin and colicin
VAVTTLSAQEVEQAAPRSTTEMLRYVPGFTRVESSGGEVNQNISMRGILGVEYVMFMEDGMPVFPTMHTFFMNADNLFRFDTNIERMEVVRGGASALFGSNTPGAIVNFINKTGGRRAAGRLVTPACFPATNRWRAWGSRRPPPPRRSASRRTRSAASCPPTRAMCFWPSPRSRRRPCPSSKT